MTTLELIDSYWLYFLVGQYPNGPLGGLALTLVLASLALLLALPEVQSATYLTRNIL